MKKVFSVFIFFIFNFHLFVFAAEFSPFDLFIHSTQENLKIQFEELKSDFELNFREIRNPTFNRNSMYSLMRTKFQIKYINFMGYLREAEAIDGNFLLSVESFSSDLISALNFVGNYKKVKIEYLFNPEDIIKSYPWRKEVLQQLLLNFLENRNHHENIIFFDYFYELKFQIENYIEKPWQAILAIKYFNRHKRSPNFQIKFLKFIEGFNFLNVGNYVLITDIMIIRVAALISLSTDGNPDLIWMLANQENSLDDQEIRHLFKKLKQFWKNNFYGNNKKFDDIEYYEQLKLALKSIHDRFGGVLGQARIIDSGFLAEVEKLSQLMFSTQHLVNGSLRNAIDPSDILEPYPWRKVFWSEYFLSTIISTHVFHIFNSFLTEEIIGHIKKPWHAQLAIKYLNYYKDQSNLRPNFLKFIKGFDSLKVENTKLIYEVTKAFNIFPDGDPDSIWRFALNRAIPKEFKSIKGKVHIKHLCSSLFVR